MSISNPWGETHVLAYTPHHCQELLHVGRDRVYALLRSGQLRGIRVGHRWIIPRAALEEYLNQIPAEQR